MGLRSVRLIDEAGKPTPFFMAQWQKTATEPLQSRTRYVEPDLTATPLLRALWAKALPSNPHLPSGPLFDADGKGLDVFWDVFT